MEKSDFLQYALENGMIDVAHLEEQVNAMRRKDILQKHQYEITLGKDGRWSTYLPYETGRKNIKKTDRKKLEDMIVAFYESEERVYTFGDVYEEWRKYHDQTVGNNSVSKYDTDKKRFFDDKKFFETDITKITEDDVKVFMVNSIKDLKLSKDPTKKLFLYIKNVFEFGLRHDRVKQNVVRFLSAKDFYGYSYDSKRSEKPQTIDKELLNALHDQFEKDHKKHPNYIPVYAVEFAALTGMRVGEIAAITWDCVFNDYILINKSQKYDPKTNSYYIDKTKNKKDRMFRITPEIRNLLDRVRSVEEEFGYVSEFVFSNQDGQINFRTICSCIKNKCRQIGITSFGIHAYRRTVNSTMSAQGIPVAVRAALLGHTKEVNERHYTFDISTMSDKKQIIENVNSQMISDSTNLFL